jgi:hypothetical protein
MKATLIKDEDGYNLMISGRTFATTDFRGVHPSANSATEHKLSLNNCQAIENGYDLDELAENTYREYPTDLKDATYHYNRDYQVHKKRKAFIKGFQKAVEILGDKKFSVSDMEKLMFKTIEFTEQEQGETYPFFKSFIQSLQQTEWAVEICCYIGNGDKESDSFKDPLVTNTGIPKLDAYGCLILRRI